MRWHRRSWWTQRPAVAVASRCLAILALLGQLLLPVATATEPLAAGETLVICTPQGFRSIALDPAAPEQQGQQHRCDFCCLGRHAGGLLPAPTVAVFPLRGAVRVADLWPSPSPPVATPRYQRPQGRAPPLRPV